MTAATMLLLRLALADPQAAGPGPRITSPEWASAAAEFKLRRGVNQTPPGDGDPHRPAAMRSSTIEWLIELAEIPVRGWRKGFLAGIFDAEGSYQRRSCV